MPDLIVDKALAAWRTRLLDMTRRNRLVYFKPNQITSLRLAAPDMYDVLGELDADGGGWEVELLDEQSEGSADGSAEDDDAVSADLDDGEDGEDGLPMGDGSRICFAADGRKKVSARLLALERRHKTDLQERGVHILYMAAGLLEWAESDGGEVVRSPLLLFPVSLSRESLLSSWRLMPADEEILLNPTLAHKLATDFRFTLPELPPAQDLDRSEGGQVAQEYFRLLREQIPASRSWRIIEEAWLDIFTFHKLVLWKDLLQNTERAANHAVVSGLAGKLENPAPLGEGGVPDARLLDRLIQPRSCFHVLDADSSQMAVLEGVRNGSSLVLQGPPGTGKSQTITNLIAQALAEKKKVLFVSEKMAALEVVKHRLEASHLGELCLELHSHKANRRDVVTALARSLDERLAPNPKGLLTETELELLQRRREQLNAYVEALHKERQPLGRSVWFVLAGLARLPDARIVPLADLKLVDALTERAWIEVLDEAKKIERHHDVVASGNKHPWHGLRPVPFAGQFRDVVREELHALDEAAAGVASRVDLVARELGFAPPSHSSESRRLHDLASLVEGSPGLPEGMLVGEPAALVGVDLLERLCGDCARLRGEIAPVLGTHRLARPLRRSELEGAMTGLTEALAPRGIALPAPAQVQTFGHALSTARERAARLRDLSARMESSLGLQARACDRRRLETLDLIAREVLESRAMPEGLLDTERHVRAASRLAQREPEWVAARDARAKLLEVAEEPILALDLERLVADFRTRYAGWTRVFKKGWRADRDAISAVLRAPMKPGAYLGVLEQAREVKRLAAIVADGCEEDAQAFGDLARGEAADAEAIRQCIARAASIIQSLPERPLPAALVSLLGTGAFQPQQHRDLCAEYHEAFGLYARVQLGGAPLDAGGIDLPEVDRRLEILIERHGPLAHCLSSLGVSARLELGYESLLEALAEVERLGSLEAQLQEAEQKWASRLGGDYRGEDSDWGRLRAKGLHASRILALLREAPSEALLRLAGQEGSTVAGRAALQAVLHELDRALGQLGTHFVDGVATALGAPMGSLDLGGIREEARAKASALDRLEEYLDVARALSVLQGLGWGEAIARILRGSTSGRAFLDSLRASVLRAWLDVQNSTCPELEQFRGSDHEVLIKEFRELDARLIASAPSRIIQQCGDRTRDGAYGEVGVIRKEAAKKRKHLPVRELMRRCPTVIPELRPCFMMSPLSVAQFLKDSDMVFDLVVFDEASQIFVEDAIGAIMRGKQIIICGDQNQLPPTSHFRSKDEDDELEDEDDEGVAASSFESILMAGTTVLKSSCLRWHYRSRHESLIHFSNASFYDSKLVTFPAAVAESPLLGVKWVHVRGAVYDRGKSRTNPREADEVTRLVLAHWKERPHESLGVVTLSLAQMTCVLDKLEAAIRASPELEEQYSEASTEPFFVKNLENVQGDERDHIILGIGYGPDKDGRVTSHFGPINSQGGWRRLNVAVTRAKRRLTLVSSLTYRDIPDAGTSPAGVKHLHKFVEYAERGPVALATALASAGEAESPLEEDIASYIATLGLGVEHQVGCSGFKVDVGVRDPDMPGCYLLGVECDGATYHSSATARDRDRLRQSILEGLGWRIHRVWGPEWIHNREREQRKLREAIEQAAEARIGHERELATAPKRAPQTEPLAPIVVEARASEPAPDAEDAPPRWAVPFHPATVNHKDPVFRRDLADADPASLGKILASLADQENGIHFERAARLLLAAWGGGNLTIAIKKQIARGLDHLPPTHHHADDFILPKSPRQEVRFPQRDTDAVRVLPEVPPHEIVLCVRHLLRENGAMDTEELARALVRLHGGQRAGRVAKEHLARILEAECARGVLEIEDGRVNLARL